MFIIKHSFIFNMSAHLKLTSARKNTLSVNKTLGHQYRGTKYNENLLLQR